MNELNKLLLRFKLSHIADVVVSGNSMLPLLHDGDIVTIKPLSEKNGLSIGNIVVFSTKDQLVIHRIVDIIPTPNHSFVKTKGDNNIHDDGYMLSSKILGIVNEKSKE